MVTRQARALSQESCTMVSQTFSVVGLRFMLFFVVCRSRGLGNGLEVGFDQFAVHDPFH